MYREQKGKERQRRRCLEVVVYRGEGDVPTRVWRETENGEEHVLMRTVSQPTSTTRDAV